MWLVCSFLFIKNEHAFRHHIIILFVCMCHKCKCVHAHIQNIYTCVCVCAYLCVYIYIQDMHAYVYASYVDNVCVYYIYIYTYYVCTTYTLTEPIRGICSTFASGVELSDFDRLDSVVSAMELEVSGPCFLRCTWER